MTTAWLPLSLFTISQQEAFCLQLLPIVAMFETIIQPEGRIIDKLSGTEKLHLNQAHQRETESALMDYLLSQVPDLLLGIGERTSSYFCCKVQLRRIKI